MTNPSARTSSGRPAVVETQARDSVCHGFRQDVVVRLDEDDARCGPRQDEVISKRAKDILERAELHHESSGDSELNMGEMSNVQTKGMELLNHFEQILEGDLLIDEVGFIHPSQFITLNEAGSQPSSMRNGTLLENGIFRSEMTENEVLNSENMIFWNRDHKLGISTQILLPLYLEAKDAFMAAIGEYRKSIELSLISEESMDGDLLHSSFTLQKVVENEVMRHSRALLLLSCDFGTAWNSRKLILSKKLNFSNFTDELLLSKLVLSCSPKSGHAWSHRKWVINMIAGESSNLSEIVNKESEFVERVAESSKMNYRAWSHRCYLSIYMTGQQVWHELKKSGDWAGLHVADSCCFHYRRILLRRLLQYCCCLQDPSASSGCNFDIYNLWKEELECNKILILRYIGREALWHHRRFLSLCWIQHFASLHSKYDASSFVDSELQLLQHCTAIWEGEFDDFEAQAVQSATYMLWLAKEISGFHGSELLEKLKALDLMVLLKQACPDKTLLWDCLFDSVGSR